MDLTDIPIIDHHMHSLRRGGEPLSLAGFQRFFTEADDPRVQAEHTGQTIERVHTDTDRDFVMEAEEALTYGIIDTVISSRQAIDRTGAIR